MNHAPTANKIIWAIDPFEEPLKSRSQLISTLAQISGNQKYRVEPVHVLNFNYDNEGTFKMSQTQLEQYKHAAEKATQQVVTGIQNIEFLPSRVFIVENYSPTKMVETLVNYAASTNAVLIVVGTHARKGISRLFLGSFAETLLLHAKLPVVTISPECLSGYSQKRILFSTDFDEYSGQFFKKVLKFAKDLSAEVILYHVVPHRVEPVLQSGAYLLSGAWVSAPDRVSESEDARRKVAEQWVHEGSEMEVSVNVRFESARGNISELILQEAKVQNVGWIAMAAESGAVASALIGSITRQIVRNAPCPVYVLRENDESSEVGREKNHDEQVRKG